MSRLIFLILFTLVSCSNVRMANMPECDKSIHVSAIHADDGALLQRMIATELIESGYKLDQKEDADILCKVKLLDESTSDLSISLKGKAQRAKHLMNFEISLEDKESNPIIKPFKISVNQSIGYLDPKNSSSFITETPNGKNSTLEFTLGQCNILNESKDASRELLFSEVASKITLYLQAIMNDKTLSISEVDA